MSGFFSTRFLRYRTAAGTSEAPIDVDRFCITCGYNVRGLRVGRSCPECGSLIVNTPGLKDPLLMGDPHEREINRLALALMALPMLIIPFLRLGLFVNLVFMPTPWSKAYLIATGLLMMMWTAGTIMLLRKGLDRLYFQFRGFRRAARWSQLLWVPAYVLLGFAVFDVGGVAMNDTWRFWSFLVRFLAVSGLLLSIMCLCRLAADAELEDEARRINLTVWMLPLPTALLAMTPEALPWIFLPLLAAVVLVWCWYVLLLGRCLLSMFRHVHWALRLAADAPLKHRRIEEARTAMIQRVNANVRQLPSTADSDLPVE